MVSLANDVHLGLSTLGEGFFCGVVFITGGEMYSAFSENITFYIVGCLGVFTAARPNMFTVR